MRDQHDRTTTDEGLDLGTLSGFARSSSTEESR